MGFYEESFDAPKTGFYEETFESQPQEQSLISKIIDRYKKVPIAGNEPLAMQRMGMRAAGQTIGALGDVAGAAIDKTGVIPALANSQTGKAVGGVVQDLGNSKILQGILSSGKYYMDQYGKLAAKNPELATDIESAANVGLAMTGTKGMKTAGGAVEAGLNTEGANIAKDSFRVASKYFQQGMDDSVNLRHSVKKAFEKAGVKPKDKIAAERFYDNATSAVQDIVKFTDPQNPISQSDRVLEAASNGLHKAKVDLYRQADALIQEAGAEGLPLINQKATIQSILDPNGKFAKVLSTNTGLRKRLEKKLVEVEKSPTATAEQIQMEIQDFNSRAASRNTISKTENTIDAMIADATRKDIEMGLQSLDKTGRAGLMKRYGALKDVEKQFADMAIKTYGRENFSYLDTISAAGGLTGLLTANPSLILAGLSTTATLHSIKAIRSPERIIRNLFKKAEKQQANKELMERLQSRYFRGKLEGLGSDPLEKNIAQAIPLQRGARPQSIGQLNPQGGTPPIVTMGEYYQGLLGR